LTARTRIEPVGRSQKAKLDGVTLHYLEYGSDGPPLVLVPGITSPAITWEFVALPLSSRFRVLVMDVRGRGLSDRPASSTYTLPEYADDLAGFVEAAGLDRPFALGHSMGARIVAAAATLFPGVLGPIVVVDPPLSGLGRPPYPFPLEVYVNALHEAQAGTTADDVRRYYPTWPERELRIRADWLATCDERAVVETYCNFHIEDFFEYWAQVAAPVLFLRGANSPAVTDAALGEITAANPAATIVSVAESGHMVPFENLDGFVEAVIAFANELEGASS
jgi:N-formylmaleamate deformylase